MHEAMGSTIGKLRDKIEGRAPGTLAKFPVSAYIALFDAYPALENYGFTSPAVSDMARAIASSAGEQTSFDYHQLLLLELISKNHTAVDASNLPAVIKALYAKNFSRIVDDVAQERQPPDFHRHTNDKFLKDLGVCNLRIIPSGSQKLNRYKFPLGALKGLGLAGALQSGIHLVTRLGGLSPVYDMHTDSHDADLMAEFSPEGWRRFYLNVAALLQVHTDVKGLYGIGWFFDSKVPEISPRLAYLRELVIETGGRLSPVGATDGARESALATSPTRRKLHEEGKYLPTDFLAIWDRGSLIRWARASVR